jgi:hypothetical protein
MALAWEPTTKINVRSRERDSQALGPVELPEEVRLLIRSGIPTVDALEILILLVRHPDQYWTAEAIGSELRYDLVDRPAITRCLGLFAANGLLGQGVSDSVIYRPASPELAASVTKLVQAYDERPVTLIRTLYAIADSQKIQAFADAFRIRKDL